MADDNIARLFESNRQWAANIKAEDPAFFETLAAQQSPDYLWIGCSDSRMPANQLLGLLPGEVFVHRNVANLVLNTDLNAQSVLQFAVEVLKVSHIIVCGHYGCGGVRAAMERHQYGLIDNWLRNIRDVHRLNITKLNALPDDEARFDALCELNVRHQAMNVCHTGIVQNAWARGQELHVHAFIYSIRDGLLKDLEKTISGPENLSPTHVLDTRTDAESK